MAKRISDRRTIFERRAVVVAVTVGLIAATAADAALAAPAYGRAFPDPYVTRAPDGSHYGLFVLERDVTPS